MVINVADIQKEVGASMSIDGSLDLEDITWQGETLQFAKPLVIAGKLVNSGNMLVLNADVHGEVILQCGSCMENYGHNLDFSFEARLVKPSDEYNPDEFVYEGNDIDLSELVWEFILLEIPIRRRCQENCKGLCPECGTNLNYKTCQCANTEENDPDLTFDERLQVLKDYFSTEGKEV